MLLHITTSRSAASSLSAEGSPDADVRERTRIRLFLVILQTGFSLMGFLPFEKRYDNSLPALTVTSDTDHWSRPVIRPTDPMACPPSTLPVVPATDPAQWSGPLIPWHARPQSYQWSIQVIPPSDPAQWSRPEIPWLPNPQSCQWSRQVVPPSDPAQWSRPGSHGFSSRSPVPRSPVLDSLAPPIDACCCSFLLPNSCLASTPV